jgi:glycerol-3-phosphate O-acyltransferase
MPSDDFFRRAWDALLSFWKGVAAALKNYIRSKIKHLPNNLPKGRRALIDAILEHKQAQEFLQQFSQESGIEVEQVEKTFRGYLNEVSADLNYLSFPFWDALLRWVFETICQGLEVDTESLEKIRAYAGKKPVVFVSSHRSHMDYLVLSYIFYNQGLPLPHICAGANLSFWPLGAIFRKSGAFFIRRSYDGNKLYAAAVQAYVEELLREKMNLEFFIEGSRSRTGKLLPPKMGILSAIAEAYWNRAADDAVLIPTSVTYESVPEEKSYQAEQAGEVKKQESFWDLFRLRKLLRNRMGKIYIEFGDPLSLGDFLQNSNKGEKKEKVRQLAYELTYGINKAVVVTPSSLSAMALLTHNGRSISDRKIEEKVDIYLDYLNFKQCHLSDFLENYRNVAIRESLKKHVRRGMVREYLQEYNDDGENLYQIREGKQSLLDYYKNSSLHFFVSLGVLSTILKAAPPGAISLAKVEEDYVFLQDLFQHEFTFSRRQSLRSHLIKVLEYLQSKKLLKIDGEQVVLFPEGPAQLSVFSSLMRNFLEGYFILWKSLPSLGEKRWEQKELLDFLQKRGEVLYIKEEIDHLEAASKSTLQNALTAFRDLSVLKEEKEMVGKKQKTFYTVRTSGETIGKKLRELL